MLKEQPVQETTPDNELEQMQMQWPAPNNQQHLLLMEKI